MTLRRSKGARSRDVVLERSRPITVLIEGRMFDRLVDLAALEHQSLSVLVRGILDGYFAEIEEGVA
jgi:hypothetical protein